MRVNGPYVHTTGKLKGRRYVNLIHDDGKRTTMLYSRYLMQEHLGRELGPDEHVDHRDEDKTNDDLGNLQLLTRSENAKKSARLRKSVEMWDFDCPQCGGSFQREASFVRNNQGNQSKSGPFCGRSCAGKASHARVA